MWGEILFWAITLGASSLLAFSLGVRLERGRQMRYEEINRPTGPTIRQGTRLRSIKIRR